MEKLIIDEEFRTIIPPLSADEYANLERSLRREGCREAIRVWDGVIVDGHNRYEICWKWGIAYQVIRMKFSSREEAISWICLNQLSRRNLTREAYKYLIGKRYDAEKAAMRNVFGKNQYSVPDRFGSGTARKTSCRLAGEYHLTHTTVERYGKFSRSLDRIEHAKPGILPSILSGQCRISQRNIGLLGGMKEEQIRSVLDTVRDAGIPASLRETGELIRQREEPDEKQLDMRIKEMPGYDPDAEVNGLMFTIPTWISMITRLYGTPAHCASAEARRKMMCTLSDLQTAIARLQKEME